MPRAEIDPQLPYIQVHRSVGPKAGRLAMALGMPYPHVRGALDIFWEDLSDRRTLRKGLDRPQGPAVVLGPTELAGKLRLAFGVAVDIGDLVLAGFLEPVPDGYRIRGMSRQLETEAARLRKGGWAPPAHRAGTVPAPVPQCSSSVPEVFPQCTSSVPAPPLQCSSSVPAPSLPPHIGERREVRGETRDVRDERGEVTGRPELRVELDPVDSVSAAGAFRLSAEAIAQAADRRALDSPMRSVAATATITPPPGPPGDGLSLRDRLEATWQSKHGAAYAWVRAQRGKEGDDDYSRTVMAHAQGDEAEVLRRWIRALNRQGFPRCGGLRDLAEHWNHYATDETRVGTGRASEADKDWSGPKPKTRMGPHGEELDYG